MVLELSGFNREFRSGGENQPGDCLHIRLEIKILSFLFEFVFTNYFSHYFEEMAGDSQSTVKLVNPHPMKIDVVKFDGTNNFGM